LAASAFFLLSSDTLEASGTMSGARVVPRKLCVAARARRRKRHRAGAVVGCALDGARR